MSTLNSKLRQVSASTIKLMTSAGKNMSVTASTGEGGLIDSNLYVGFKQPSVAKTADPYQVQYRVRYRYTAANRKSKNATFSATWANSPWKNAVASTGIAFGASTNPNTWNKANLYISTSTSYRTILNLKNTQIASGYEAVQYQFRIRTFNKAKLKHGNWSVSEALTIWKRIKMEDETLHRAEDGGLYMDCNCVFNGIAGKFYVTSVKSGANELLKSTQSGALQRDGNRTALAHPPLRSGFDPMEFTIGADKLKRSIVRGEKLNITAYFLAENGTKTYWLNKSGVDQYVSKEDTTLDPPRMTISQNKNSGIVIVKVYKGDNNDAISGASCSAMYYPNDSATGKSLEPIWTKGSMTSMTTTTPAEFYFLPPLNSKVVVTATLKSSYGKAETKSASKAIYLSNDAGFILNSTASMSLFASVCGNPEIVEDMNVSVTTKVTNGRSRPFAVFDKARQRPITLSGTLYKGGNLPIANATREAWEKMTDSTQVYVLRTPDGRVVNVALQSIRLTQKMADIVHLSADMVEVS